MNAGWEALTQALAEVGAAIAAQAPDAETAAEGEAYLLRNLAAGLGGAALGHLFARDGLSAPLPCQGGPNPDYVMRFAQVDPARRYSLEGRLNGSERIGVGLYAPNPKGGLLPAGYAAFDQANAPDGRFAIDLGAGAEAEGGLEIPPQARILLLRVLHRDPDAEVARLRLTGNPPAPGLALAGGSADAALAFVAGSLATNVREYLRWTRAALSLSNRLAPAPPELAEAVQGDPDTLYILGGFDLGEGDWLEVTLPGDLPGYWSLHAYNIWFEHLQTAGVDDLGARRDEDGRIRIAIGPNPPAGARNRIDTPGRRRGALIGRFIGAAHRETGVETCLRNGAD